MAERIPAPEDDCAWGDVFCAVTPREPEEELELSQFFWAGTHVDIDHVTATAEAPRKKRHHAKKHGSKKDFSWHRRQSLVKLP